MPTDQALRARVKRLWVALVTLYLIALVTIVVVGVVAVQTRQSLCSFRADLRQRVDTTEALLNARNSNGMLVYPKFVFGVQRSVVEATLVNQRRTLHSLGGTLLC